MKVLIFGGKFNPLHQGHKAIVKEVGKQLSFDEVWIMPNGLPTSKQFIQEETRLRIIKEFCKEHNFKFVDFESKQEKYIDTIDTVKYLKTKYNHDFYFLIGSDQANDFASWPQAKELSQTVKLICATRKGYEVKKNQEFNIQYLEVDAPKASSSLFRKGELDKIDINDLKILAQDNGFWSNYLQNTLSQDRFIHSLNVALRAKELAMKYLPAKINKAYTTGLLHDISKEWKTNDHHNYLKAEFRNEPTQTWHQWSGANFVKEIGIDDQEIIDAIQNHTTTNLEMSDFDKIVFCADKTSVERNYKELPSILEACDVSLEKCFEACFEAKVKFLDQKNIKITQRTKEIIKKWDK